jgi:uncharacterized protein (TIGR04141 family)
MPPAGPKTQHLTYLLLKDDLADFDSALVEGADVRPIAVDPDAGFEGELYIERRAPRPPSWAGFVQTGVTDDLNALVNASTSAVLLLRAGGRMFALTFGYGRHLLRPDVMVRDFGLKVVLNTVDPDRLRSVELRVIEDVVINRRTDVSKASSPGSFGLDPGRDILRGVAGQPTDRNLYGRQLVGSDALIANLPVEFADLDDVAVRLLAAYQDTAYRHRFGWVDHVRQEREPDRIATLDALLLEAIQGDADPGPYLAPPGLLEWSNVEFGYSRDRGRHLDLDLDDYLANVDIEALDVPALRKHDVRVYSMGSTEVRDHWTLYDCLVFETRHDGGSFVLSEGQWFKVDGGLVEEVATKLAAIPLSTVDLPLARDGEGEPAYNRRAAADRPNGRALLDADESQVASERGPIEICDLMTDRGEFIHVKRKTQSQRLSVLFAQGRISAEVFRQDSQFRERVRAKLLGTHPDIANLIPAAHVRFNPHAFETVYAVVTNRPAGFPINLPFFSRLNLVRTYEYLSGTLNYRVSVLAIGIEPGTGAADG